MSPFWLIDAHLDLAWNALQWNRNLLEPVHVIRVQEATQEGAGRALGTVALPELHAAKVGLCFATLLARSSGNIKPHIDYPTAEQANAAAWGQLAYYRALEKGGHLHVLTDREQLMRHTQEIATKDDVPLGVILSMEGADPIIEPDDLPSWVTAGVRIIGLVHYGSGRYAGGTGTNEGLTDFGRLLLDGMEEQGVLLDVAHLSDKAFWESMERFKGPVLASHCNCRALVPHQRQLDDEQIKALVSRRGVIGVACDAWMLSPGWIKGHSHNQGVTLDLVADHIDHICQLTGSTSHVGIGSDLDGGFGHEQCPRDLDTIADLACLTPILQGRGYRESDIEAIFHGNWLRLLREHLAELADRIGVNNDR